MTYSVCSQKNKFLKFTSLWLRRAWMLPLSGLMNGDITAVVCSSLSLKKEEGFKTSHVMNSPHSTVVSLTCAGTRGKHRNILQQEKILKRYQSVVRQNTSKAARWYYCFFLFYTFAHDFSCLYNPQSVLQRIVVRLNQMMHVTLNFGTLGFGTYLPFQQQSYQSSDLYFLWNMLSPVIAAATTHTRSQTCQSQ